MESIEFVVFFDQQEDYPAAPGKNVSEQPSDVLCDPEGVSLVSTPPVEAGVGSSSGGFGLSPITRSYRLLHISDRVLHEQKTVGPGHFIYIA